MALIEWPETLQRFLYELDCSLTSLGLLVEVAIPAVVPDYERRAVFFDLADAINEGAAAVRRTAGNPQAARARCDLLLADLNQLTTLVSALEWTPVYTTDGDWMTPDEVAEFAAGLRNALDRMREGYRRLRASPEDPGQVESRGTGSIDAQM